MNTAVLRDPKRMIVCKSAAEIEKMRRSGHIVRQVLDCLRTVVAPGITTMDLEQAAEKKIEEFGKGNEGRVDLSDLESARK